jgi:hypothetical protein
MVNFAMKIDLESLQQRAESNELLVPFGLDFHNPPIPEIFKSVAEELSGITFCRFVNSVHIIRMFHLDIAYRSVCKILDDPKVAQDPSKSDVWLNFQDTLNTTARSEADLILSTLPFYIPPGSGPLNPTNLLPLVWPLASFGSSMQLLPEQQYQAKEALRQIGSRGRLPMVTRLVESQFQPGASCSWEALMLHLSLYI